MRSPGVGRRAPRRRADRRAALAARAPARRVDGPPRCNYTAIGAGVPGGTTVSGWRGSSGSTTSRSRSATIDEALAWYGQFFELELRGRAGASMAFIDMGDQFIALARGRTQPPDARAALRSRRRRQGGGARRARSRRRRGDARAELLVPRSVGEPRAGRRLPRRAVHEDAGDLARDGARRSRRRSGRSRSCAQRASS